MEAVKFLRIGRELLKTMSSFGLRLDDYKHIEMYEEYVLMRERDEKVDYVLSVLSDKYGMSESTVKRVVKRLSREVKV